MSVVIGYVTDQFSILMTDTRITFGKNAEFGWDDENDKLVSIPNMGWVTGVGVSDFISRFHEKLTKTKISTVRNIEDLYMKTLENEKREFAYLGNHIDSTVITCSWLGLGDDSIRLGMFCKEYFGHNLVELLNNQINILYPYDYLEDFSKIDKIQNRIKFEYNGNFENLLELLLLIFAEISANSPGVSSICDIGIQLFLGNEVYKLRIKKDISPLIKAAENGTLINMLSVVN